MLLYLLKKARQPRLCPQPRLFHRRQPQRRVSITSFRRQNLPDEKLVVHNPSKQPSTISKLLKLVSEWVSFDLKQKILTELTHARVLRSSTHNFFSVSWPLFPKDPVLVQFFYMYVHWKTFCCYTNLWNSYRYSVVIRSCQMVKLQLPLIIDSLYNGILLITKIAKINLSKNNLFCW